MGLAPQSGSGGPAPLPDNSDGVPAPLAADRGQPDAQTVPGPGNGTPAHFESACPSVEPIGDQAASDAPPPVDADEPPSGQAGPACSGCGVEVATNEGGNWTDNLLALIAAAVESPLTIGSCWHKQPQ
jgi:hypothetical protein